MRLLLAVVERLRKKNIFPSADEMMFVRADGKAEVQIWLTDKSERTLAQLKATGLEVMLDAKNFETDYRSSPDREARGVGEVEVCEIRVTADGEVVLSLRPLRISASSAVK